MFEADIYNKLSAIQDEIAEIRQIYRPYTSPDLEDALGGDAQQD